MRSTGGTGMAPIDAAIRRSAPCGEVVQHGDSVEIGTVIWRDGKVTVIPRHGLTREQLLHLDRAAEDAFYRGPDPAWTPDLLLGWVGCVRVRQPRCLRSSSMCSALGAPHVTDRMRARSSRFSRASSSPPPAMVTASVSAN